MENEQFEGVTLNEVTKEIYSSFDKELDEWLSMNNFQVDPMTRKVLLYFYNLGFRNGSIYSCDKLSAKYKSIKESQNG